VPSVRFSRDKRGYEYVYLVHTPMRRGKPGRTRVLYWYRTPPGVRIGRKPFDEEVQRTIEQQNPGVTFDWEAIIATPMPPPDMTEFWRERRRAEKAARQERRAMEGDEPPVPPDVPGEDAGTTVVVPEMEAAEDVATDGTGEPAEALPSEPATSSVDGGDAIVRKRRRRRGGRRRPPTGEPLVSADTTAGASADDDSAGEPPSEEARAASEEVPSKEPSGPDTTD
jgi:hypothetical protein